MYNNFEISLVVFMPNITTNHAITYTNIILKHLNNISGTFLTECLSKQPLSKLSKCNFTVSCMLCLMYLLSGQKKKKNLLPGMYSCPKDEHIQELTMKPASERNKIKQDRS